MTGRSQIYFFPRLVAIQDHVSGQIEGYMNQIRTSLRKFRQDLDGMLSSLRNSNARFRKSFKYASIFSWICLTHNGIFSTAHVRISQPVKTLCSHFLSKSLEQLLDSCWRQHQTRCNVVLPSLRQTCCYKIVKKLTTQGCNNIVISWLYQSC